MPLKHTCAYEGKTSDDIPPCEGDINYVVRGYWRGEARKKHGPDMWLCEGHGVWSAKLNPFGFPREKVA